MDSMALARPIDLARGHSLGNTHRDIAARIGKKVSRNHRWCVYRLARWWIMLTTVRLSLAVLRAMINETADNES